MRFLFALALSVFAVTCLIAHQPANLPAPATAVAATVVNVDANALSSLKDFKATGTITYSDTTETPQGTITMRGVGLENLRCDVSVAGQTRSWLLRGLSGSAKRGDANPTSIPVEIVANLKHYAMPFAALAKHPEQTSALPPKDGDTPQMSRIAFDFSNGKQRPGWKNTKTEFLVDTSTGQVLSLSGNIMGKGSRGYIQRQELVFSDYRNVSGIMFPFTVEERLDGHTISVVHWDQISLNTGLSISDLAF